jgi:hypothetical protein
MSRHRLVVHGKSYRRLPLLTVVQQIRLENRTNPGTDVALRAGYAQHLEEGQEAGRIVDRLISNSGIKWASAAS